MDRRTRREFLAGASMVSGGIAALGGNLRGAPPQAPAKSQIKLGIVTYNIAKGWSLDEIIQNLAEVRFQGVELRTGHAHGVELSLSPRERAAVRDRFAGSPIKIVQLGSTYEFQSPDPAVLRENIEGCKQYMQLAHDVGAPAVKVRPNGLETQAGIPVEKTLEQIGMSLRELGETGSRLGVEVRLEVHGKGTERLDYIQRIMEIANQPMVAVNWNCNQTDLEDGGLEENFARVKKWIRNVHMRDLYLEEYPWRKLIGLLQGIGYGGYCCAEIPSSEDPLRVLLYYRALFLQYEAC
jgi:sugar phosphate isomerase/epimerase